MISMGIINVPSSVNCSGCKMGHRLLIGMEHFFDREDKAYPVKQARAFPEQALEILAFTQTSLAGLGLS